MDYVRSYKSFVNSYYLNESIRITSGILLPAFLMAYFNLLQTGIVISLGAMFVTITDIPGPIHHRKNGMVVCNIALFIVAIISGFVNTSPLLLGLFLIVACFLFSMIAIYGTRAGAIGIAALIMLVLDIGQQRSGWDILKYALLVSSGGVWYMSYSMLLNNFRPYKIIQQALGEWIQHIASFLVLRSEFYQKDVNYTSTSGRLLQQQALVQEKQNVVNELLFKTRSVVKESTNTGRILVMLYLDAAEMFEKIMTSYQSYSTLHNYFDETGILEEYRLVLLQIANELQEVGIAVAAGSPSQSASTLSENLKRTRHKYQQLRQTYLRPDNINGFISLNRILENIQDIADRLQTLHKYTTYDKAVKKRKRHEVDYNSLVTHEPVKPSFLLDNLSLKSDIFRHSVRLSLAVLAGYSVSLFIDIGHSYWILLTIIVILKPAYSLTKKRNTDRLSGTILGVLIGVLILLIIKTNVALLIVMIIFMLGYFSTMRTNYFLSVMLMTPYVVIFFHLLYPGEFSSVVKDRIVDTAIGSTIAFLFIYFVLPSWERQKINALMIAMVEKDKAYFTIIGNAFLNDEKILPNALYVARKETLVALANLSDAFNRMLSEPKSQQKGIDDVHKFVVLNHMFTSYTATLSGYLKLDINFEFETELKQVVENINLNFSNAYKNLKGEKVLSEINNESLHSLNEHAESLLATRKSELELGYMDTSTRNTLLEVKSIVDQFNLVYKASEDISKISNRISFDT